MGDRSLARAGRFFAAANCDDQLQIALDRSASAEVPADHAALALQLDVPMTRGIIDFATFGQLLIVTPFCLAGAMAPIDLAKGFGVDQDYAEAMRWFRKGDAMGDTSAMLNIGAMYRDGTGVKEDQAEAVRRDHRGELYVAISSRTRPEVA